jgi:hypothetical protein
MKQKRTRLKIGQVFRVDLKDGYYAFGQVIREMNWAFFDLHTKDPNPPLGTIVSSPVLFKIGVYTNVIKHKIWEVIGICPPREELLKEENTYMYDALLRSYIIFKPIIGGAPGICERVPAIWEECKNLEREAVWPAGSVEQRLRDHFAGRPNWDLESNKPGWQPISMKDFYKQYGYDFHWLGDQDTDSSSITEVTNVEKGTKKIIRKIL